MLDLVGYPEDQFSCVAAHLSQSVFFEFKVEFCVVETLYRK